MPRARASNAPGGSLVIGSAYRVTLTFTEPVLGTAPRNQEVYSDYIASRAPTETDTTDELATLVEPEKIGTAFHRHQGQPCLFDYHIRGFFKEAASALVRSKDNGLQTTKLKAFRKAVDNLVFVRPRIIPLVLPAGATTDEVERPLRAQTAQGERVALARSERAPAGTTATFTVHVLGEVSEAMLTEWLEYAQWKGIGQWRNGGNGTATYTLEKA